MQGSSLGLRATELGNRHPAIALALAKRLSNRPPRCRNLVTLAVRLAAALRQV